LGQLIPWDKNDLQESRGVGVGPGNGGGKGIGGLKTTHDSGGPQPEGVKRKGADGKTVYTLEIFTKKAVANPLEGLYWDLCPFREVKI